MSNHQRKWMWIFLGNTDKKPIPTTKLRLESDLFLISLQTKNKVPDNWFLFAVFLESWCWSTMWNRTILMSWGRVTAGLTADTGVSSRADVLLLWDVPVRRAYVLKLLLLWRVEAPQNVSSAWPSIESSSAPVAQGLRHQPWTATSQVRMHPRFLSSTLAIL